MDKIWFKEEIYQGPQAKYAPDLVFISKGYAYLGRQLFGDHKIIRSAENLPVGFHRSDGIFIARGSMAQQDREIRGAEIADIAPTVLYAMGLPVPDDMDGKVLGEVFGNELLKQRPVEFEEAAEDQAEDEEEIYSQEESEKIKERLKSLGYIE